MLLLIGDHSIKARTDNIDNIDNTMSKQNCTDSSVIDNVSTTYEDGKYATNNMLSQNGYVDSEIEAGYIDSTNQMRLGKLYSVTSENEKDAEQMETDTTAEQYINAAHKFKLKNEEVINSKITKDNPFLNIESTQCNVPSDSFPIEFNADDQNIHQKITDEFNKDLFQNIDDLWEIKNSQRQFFTMPNINLPNQQKEFAQWLYYKPFTCKTDQTQCLRYEDLRYKR
jgi:hypothetical protein